MKKFIIGLIFVLLLVIPLVANGNLYYLGGDDMRLYYVYPEKYLENYVFNKIGGNTLAGANTGFATVAYYAPMFYFIKLLKFIPLNTQFLMYGMNMAFGFLFFYKFLGLYIKKGYWEKIVGSLFYLLSPFLIATYYQNQLLSMYLISIIPACWYFFIRAVRENKFYLTLLAVGVFSAFSTTINTLPWWSAFFIPTLLLLAYEFSKNKKSFIVQTSIASIFFAFINSYWLVDFVKARIFPTGITGEDTYYNSQAFLADNLRVMQGVATAFNPVNIVFNNLEDHLDKASLINTIYILVVIAPFLLLKNKIKKSGQIQYLLFFLVFLVSWYLFSPNITLYGPKIMLYITRKLPVFGMYRNMFDKFSLPLSFSFALVLTYSLNLLRRSLFRKVFISLNIILLVLTIYNARNFLMFKYSPEQDLYRISGKFNKEYLELVGDIKNMSDKSKVVWLPLNYPTYSVIEDKDNPGHYYFGLSPLRILADSSDYAGGFSFITQTDTFADRKIWTLLESKKYDEVGKIFQKMGAKYVVVDKQICPNAMKPYLFGGEDLKLLSYQQHGLFDEVLGKKIKEYGNRYEMYQIKEKYMSSQIYLASDADGVYEGGENLNYEKLSNNEYKLSLNENVDGYLVFLESYDKNWKLSKDGNLINAFHADVLGYANVWNLQKTNLEKGDILTIKFQD